MGRNIAIDLGTASCSCTGEGIDEPSVVAVNKKKKEYWRSVPRPTG